MLTAILLFALADPGRQRASLPPPTDWKIEISTTGGFTGAGGGGLTLSSNGTLVITMINKKSCTYQLTASELQMVSSAIAAASPASWLECYSLANVNTHCCDLITTTMSLSQRGGRDVYIVSWLTGTPPFPADLQNLVDVLRGPAGIDARYRQLCASAP